MKIRPFEPGDAATVMALWQECGLTRPWNDPQADIARKCAQQPELFLVGEVAGTVVATVARRLVPNCSAATVTKMAQ